MCGGAAGVGLWLRVCGRGPRAAAGDHGRSSGNLGARSLYGRACMVRGVGGVLSVAAARRRTLRCVYECTGSERVCQIRPPAVAARLHAARSPLSRHAAPSRSPPYRWRSRANCFARLRLQKRQRPGLVDPGRGEGEPARQPVQAGERSIRCSSCAVSECSVVHRLPGRRHMHAVPHSNVG